MSMAVDDVFLDMEDLEYENEEEEVETSKTYAIDFDQGRAMGMIDGLEAVEQFIRKAIMTERFKFLIYDDQYGCEIQERMRDSECSQAYLEEEIPRLIEDALSEDERITEISNFEFEFEADAVYIRFEVSTILGDLMIEEVIG